LRVFDRYFFFALVVSTVPILVLYNGLAGSHGNSPVTGIFIVSSLAAVALFNQWRRFVPNLCDAAFVAYVGCIAVSFWLNGIDDIKEAALLILTLAAYPAARFFVGTGLQPTFVFVTLPIVTAGAGVTAFELVRQWDNTFEKPSLFGLGGAGGNFLISLGFAMIAMTCLNMPTRQRIVAGILIALETVIFAASMVRLAFIAILVSLALSALFSTPARKRQIAIVIVVTIVAIATGLFVRSEKTIVMAGFAANGFKTLIASAMPGDVGMAATIIQTGEKRLPSCSSSININDSIDIRLGLLRDAVELAKNSGWFGIGLGGFMKLSCIPSIEVHNSFLQAVIEFGWTGSIALLALVGIAVAYLLPLAQSHPEARFALCSLTCITILTLGSGRTSHDGLLFLFLGFASGLHNFSLGAPPVETVS
jgi:hypothetical protein